MSEADRGKDSRFQWSLESDNRPERALVLVPDIRSANEQPHTADGAGGTSPDRIQERSLEARLQEAVGLARAIDLEIVSSAIVPVRQRRPATLIGAGKVDEITGLIKAEEIGLAVVDHPLTPVQQRNLEKAWNCKVLDRTGLILEIFGARARTREGRLQVELAHLNYQKGRLVRQWTHLERQRGGLGKTGGPGETQIEADRRLLQDRIIRLERDLEKVRRTRDLHRAKRKKTPVPVVALVGYTNAGKSTLFNKLTGAAVLAKDQLFATLDPTLRKLRLPGGGQIILSDTVGFVSNLPTMLVAAFRATLEEVLEADLILHVRDIADPDSQAQAQDVYTILSQLGVEQQGHDRVIEVWNKTDLLEPESLAAMRAVKTAQRSPVLVSALTGEGVDGLLAAIETGLASGEDQFNLVLGVTDLGRLPWIYENTQVIERKNRKDGSVALKLRGSQTVRNKLSAMARAK
ncbi:MAG: GTPase HflX [Rhizobiaceae bacterium]